MKYKTEEERKQAKREYNRQWREKNSDYDKQYYQANREKRVEQKKQYYQANREKILEQQKQYRKDNADKIAKYYTENKEKKLEWRKLYNKTPMGRALYLANSHKREDKKYNRGECSLTSLWVRNYIFPFKCVYCGEDDWRKLGCDRKDNSLPHTPSNVVPCCGDCNTKRGTKPFEEFVAECNAQERLKEWEEFLKQKDLEGIATT